MDDEMANAAEVIAEKAEAAERRRILIMALEFKAAGKSFDEFISELQAMDKAWWKRIGSRGFGRRAGT